MHKSRFVDGYSVYLALSPSLYLLNFIKRYDFVKENMMMMVVDVMCVTIVSLFKNASLSACLLTFPKERNL